MWFWWTLVQPGGRGHWLVLCCFQNATLWATFYRTFKDQITFSPYLDGVSPKLYRISLSRLRTSSHRLGIETGRWPRQGPPYIPRVHLSEGSLVRNLLKWLWSEEPMVRRSFIPKFLYSESCYVPKIPYSERSSTIWILWYEDSLVRSSSSPKGAMFRTSLFRKSPLPIRVLYYEGPLVRSSPSSKIAMFRRFYLCYEGSSWWYLNVSGHNNITILVQCIYFVIMKLSAKYFIDVLMIWICLVIVPFINHKISLGVTILDPSRHLAYSRNSIISHLKTQK